MKVSVDKFRFHNISRFPACIFRDDILYPGYADIWEKEMASILTFKRPFTVIFSSNFIEATKDRAQRGVWLKRNQEALREYCRGIITIIENEEVRNDIIRQGAASTKIFNINHEIVASLEQAITLTQQLVGAIDKS